MQSILLFSSGTSTPSKSSLTTHRLSITWLRMIAQVSAMASKFKTPIKHPTARGSSRSTSTTNLE